MINILNEYFEVGSYIVYLHFIMVYAFAENQRKVLLLKKVHLLYIHMPP
jgi:hypothetical protein